MKTNKRALFEVLKNINKIVPQKSSHDILTTVKLESVGDMLSLTGTDGKNTLTAALPCEGTDISICVSSKQLQQILKPEGKSDNSNVTLYKEEGMLVIECLGVKTKIPTMNPDDFPVTEEVNWELAAIWPAKKFLDALTFTSIAACTDITRPHICCVCITDNVVVSTNGHALHKCAAPSPVSRPLLLHLETVNALLSILRFSDDVIIARADDQVRIKAGPYLLQSQLVDDEFPPYDQVIPKDQSTMVKLKTAGFLRALRRVRTLSAGLSGIKMTVNGSMELSVENEYGAIAVDVPLKSNGHRGDAFVAGYNPVYLLAAIPQGSPEITLTMEGPLDPIVIRDDGNNRKAIVMPMRI